MSKEVFNLEYQYQLYLKRVALSEANMHPEQKKQLRQAFMGACGQMLMLLQDEIGDIEKEQDAIEVLQDMKNQVGDYFLNIKREQN